MNCKECNNETREKGHKMIEVEKRIFEIKKIIDSGVEAELDKNALLFCLDVTKKLVDKLLVDLQLGNKPANCMMIKPEVERIQSAESGGLT